MDVLEKLVELLMDMPFGNSTEEAERAHTEAVAEYLIANGVTVQECGHWEIIVDDYDCEMMQCSVCEEMFYDGDNDTVDCLHNYCPCCGAKMMPQPPKGE